MMVIIFIAQRILMQVHIPLRNTIPNIIFENVEYSKIDILE